MQQVELRNGSYEGSAIVAGVVLSLESMMESGGKQGSDAMTDAMSVIELKSLCENPEHEIFSDQILERLESFNLVQLDGQVRSSVKNVVLSALEGEGLEMKLVNPIKQ